MATGRSIRFTAPTKRRGFVHQGNGKRIWYNESPSQNSVSENGHLSASVPGNENLSSQSHNNGDSDGKTDTFRERSMLFSATVDDPAPKQNGMTYIHCEQSAQWCMEVQRSFAREVQWAV